VFGDGRPVELMVRDEKKGDEKKTDVKKDGKKEKTPRFTVGFRLNSIKWYPVWRREKDPYIRSNQNKNIRPMLSYQPELSLAINDRLRISASGSYAENSNKHIVTSSSYHTFLEMGFFYTYYNPAFLVSRSLGFSNLLYDRDIKKYDSRTALNWTVADRVDLIIGTRFQGYSLKQRGAKTFGVGYFYPMVPSSYISYYNIPYESWSEFRGVGPEAGISVKLQINRAHYISPKITAFLLSFSEKNGSLYFAGGNARGVIAGFASSCVFGIILPGTGVSFELGASLDYLIYHINRSSIYTGRSKSVRDETLGYNAAVFYSI
jgi:hypothetical protein